MIDTRRDELIEFIEREFIGPDPIDWEGLIQENGEEVLAGDPPRTRYIAGILFPQATKEEDVSLREEEVLFNEKLEEESSDDIEILDVISNTGISETEYLEDAEELLNLSNAYKPSAISLTTTIADGDRIFVEVSAGRYTTSTETDSLTGRVSTLYPRTPISWENEGMPITLPSAKKGLVKIDIPDTALRFDITYRYKRGDDTTFTFTLENTKINNNKFISDEDCYFQVKFKVLSEKGFCPLPENEPINKKNEDYLSNRLLYRSVKSYATGHGCATDWDDRATPVKWIATAIFPKYDIKPIVPSRIEGVSLEMFKMSDLGNFSETIDELNILCDRYADWIDDLHKEALSIGGEYRATSTRHIENCNECLQRMRNGVSLLEEDHYVRTAFQYMNQAMLLQQLHYNLPIQKWIEGSDGELVLENPVQMPLIEDSNTWFEKEERIYGMWRPFQLAFILMNLESMNDKNSSERNIVDLIWFPTGGGKTEAYLGLSAYTIFIRRLKDKNDSGTTILMRYTLRLLTAQQYQRASAMICACELIRERKKDILGNSRISIGLWVGGETTPNSMVEAVKAFVKLYNRESDFNPFVMLQCPWCGAQMGVVDLKNQPRKIQGYKKILKAKDKKQIIFQCSNHVCSFSSDNFPLPLYVVDDMIYENPPTLLLGTVDKFAMLPFRPEAQSIFGYKNGKKITSPDLIIQDELHLISGPLGSMVGHYETLIYELCCDKTINREIYPKIVASTATISRAKEQCHALYGCGTDNVFQFPPQGLDAGNSFFAKEDTSQNGRKYVGILAPGASSEATAAIRLYAALLYAAKEIKVESEALRDPYWTNVGYFNSIRELGHAATWIKADIEQYLDVMYKRRYENKKYPTEEYRRRRRYIYRDEELTSRIRSDKVNASLENLKIVYPPEHDESDKIKEHPIDICLATNMISVGLDVSRLGLMTVAGQPKTTSEYIQATSRVGRDSKKAPGVVFILYKPGRPRDKSHFEQFKSYHSRIYTYVEPTSVTPFSAPVRERALHAVLIGMLRLEGNSNFNNDPPELPDLITRENVRQVIKERLEKIDQTELENTLRHFDFIFQCWEDWNPRKFHDFRSGDELPLMFPAGSRRNTNWGESQGFGTPTSMRSVDAECQVQVLPNRY